MKNFIEVDLQQYEEPFHSYTLYNKKKGTNLSIKLSIQKPPLVYQCWEG